MTCLVHTLALAALILLSLDARLAQVRADDRTDCVKASGDTAIRGCSRIINSRRLFGKSISKKNLAIMHNNRGVAHGTKGQDDRAIADFDKAIKINPKFAKAYTNRGIIYGDKRQYERAIAEYTHAIKLNPQYIEAYNNRAWAYFKWGQAAEGLHDVNKAIEKKPKYAKAYDTRAHIYETVGRNDAAIADFRKAFELDPSDYRREQLTRLGMTPSK